MAVDGTGVAGGGDTAPAYGTAWGEVEQEHGAYLFGEAVRQGVSGGGQGADAPCIPRRRPAGGVREAGAGQFSAEGVSGQRGQHGGFFCEGRPAVGRGGGGA